MIYLPICDMSLNGNYREGKDFSLLHSVQTGSGAHPASYSMDPGGCFPRDEEAGARS
jgi:hypothetical protein